MRFRRSRRGSTPRLPSPTPPRSGLARLREEHEDGKDDLPRNDLEEGGGSNRVGGQAHGYGQESGGPENCPHGSHTHGRRLKITSCSASARMPQTARPLETFSQRTGGAMLMAVLEGRAPNRRPHHAVEVAVTSCRQPRIDETSGPRGGLLCRKNLCRQDKTATGHSALPQPALRAFGVGTALRRSLFGSNTS